MWTYISFASILPHVITSSVILSRNRSTCEVQLMCLLKLSEAIMIWWNTWEQFWTANLLSKFSIVFSTSICPEIHILIIVLWMCLKVRLNCVFSNPRVLFVDKVTLYCIISWTYFHISKAIVVMVWSRNGDLEIISYLALMNVFFSCAVYLQL